MNVCKVPDMCKDMEYKYITEDSKTSHNCGMPASVKAFVAAFEKLMKEREEKTERKCG